MPKTTKRGSFLPKQITLPVTLYQDLILVMNCRWGRAPIERVFQRPFPLTGLRADSREVPTVTLTPLVLSSSLFRVPLAFAPLESALPPQRNDVPVCCGVCRLRIRSSRGVKAPGEAPAGFTPVPVCCAGWWKLHGIKLTAMKMR